MIRSRMNELAWRPHFPIISLWGIFWRSRAANSIVSGRIWPKFDSLCMSPLPARIKRIGSKITDERRKNRFPHYKSMGAFCCHGNQSVDRVCPKTLCNHSLTPVMLHIKFDQDWPTGFRDIQVWKYGQRTTDDGRTTHHWYTISSPCEPSAQVS